MSFVAVNRATGAVLKDQVAIIIVTNLVAFEGQFAETSEFGAAQHTPPVGHIVNNTGSSIFADLVVG
jgi:hypothetical protein